MNAEKSPQITQGQFSSMALSRGAIWVLKSCSRKSKVTSVKLIPILRAMVNLRFTS
jgi:hypothetical protein